MWWWASLCTQGFKHVCFGSKCLLFGYGGSLLVSQMTDPQILIISLWCDTVFLVYLIHFHHLPFLQEALVSFSVKRAHPGCCRVHRAWSYWSVQTPAFQPLLSDRLAQHSGRRLLVIWEFSDPSDVLSLSLSSARMLIRCSFYLSEVWSLPACV